MASDSVVVDPWTSNTGTLSGSEVTQHSPDGSGASFQDPSAWMISFLWQLVQNGISFSPWVFTAIALALQKNGASDSSQRAIGEQNQPQSFVYQDSGSVNSATTITDANRNANTIGSPLFDAWGALLGSHLAADEAVTAAVDSTAPGSSVLAAANLAQSHGDGVT
jgi:hypothetical protein